MRKVIKIFFSVIGWAVLASIIIPLWAALLLCLPPVQTFAVRQAAKVVSRNAGIDVSVEKVSIKFFNRLALRGLYVGDHRQDTLFYVRELSVGMAAAGLFGKGDLSLGRVKLVEPVFYLHQQADSMSNLKHLLMQLSSDKERKKDGIFNMHVSAVEIEDMHFVHTKYVKEERGYGVNFTDLDVYMHRLDVEKVSVNGDSISMKIKDISLLDKSGFSVEALASDVFSVSSGGLRFKGLEIDASGSHIEMDSLNLLYTDWVMDEFLKTVTFESRMRNTTVDFRTIAFFAEGLRDWNLVVSDIDASVQGPVADMEGRFRNAAANGADLAMSFSMKGLPETDNTVFNFNISKFAADAGAVRAILSDVPVGIKVGESLYRVLGGMGVMNLGGRFSGRLSDFVSSGKLSTGYGQASFDMHITPRAGKVTGFAGNLKLKNARLGAFFGYKELGTVSLSADVRGSVGKGNLHLDTEALVSQLDFKGYDYHDLAVKGMIRNRLFKGEVSSPDPNIDFDFDGMLDFNDSVPHYDFALELRKADLAKLNLNKRDSISVLAANVRAAGSGTSLDDLNGRIGIEDVLYIYNADTLRTGAMTVTGRNSPDSKNIELRSDFADADFRSRTSYKELFPQVKKMLEVYMPTLAPRTRADDGEEQATVPAVASNYSLLKLEIKDNIDLPGILLPGLAVADGTKLSLTFNPHIRKFTLTGSSEYIEYKNHFASNIEINGRDEGDSLALYLRADDLYLGGIYMPGFSVNAGARDNVINAATRFSNTDNGMSALIGVRTVMARDSLDGSPVATIRFTPSTFTADNKTWNIYTRGITVGRGRVDFDAFTVSGQGQSLSLDGVVSDSSSDTVRLTLKDFDVAPISQLTSTLGFETTGKLNGNAQMSSVLKNGIMYAKIDLDSIIVNTSPVPSSVFESMWDFESERAKFTFTEKGAAKPAIRGYYRPRDGSYMGFMDVKGIDMALLQPFLEGVISDISGTMDADLEFTGTGPHLKVNGSVKVPEVRTRVDYTNVYYNIRGGIIDMQDNKLTLKRTKVYDEEGNSGQFDLSVNLNNLKNIIYSVNAKPDGIMALNTTDLDNDMFYGKVYASGAVDINGDRRATNIFVNATTAGRSEFHLPLSGKADAVRSNLVVFKQPDTALADSADYNLRKRRIVERRRRESAQTADAALTIDMVLNVRPNALVEIVIDPKMGGLLRGRGNGSLTMNINPATNAFAMYGDYRITEGVYVLSLQDIIERTFSIEEGSNIQWTGEPENARLDISAVYKLKTSIYPLLANQLDGEDGRYRGTVPVECKIFMTDRLSNPKMTFDIALPSTDLDPQTQSLVASALSTQEMVATQFFSLLATRNFYQDMGQGMNIGLASGGTDQLVNILSAQVSNWLSNDRFNIGFNYRAQSEYNSDEFNVDFSTSLAGDRLLLEVEGNYDAQNTPGLSEKNPNSLSGDFALTWLIDKGGNLRLKGFSRTIDRFDENLGMQESGIGLYYREDFDTFGDVLRNFRQRFSIFGQKKKKRNEVVTKNDAADVPEEAGKGADTSVAAVGTDVTTAPAK